jgi:LCP family protein required for cell wall assembly
LGVGLLYGYVRYRASQLKTAKCPSCLAATGVTSAGLKPMNILLIGSNTRTGLDPGEAAQFGSSSQVPGARSDVTMILHLDPATGAASLLSIPRDLFVPLPAHSMSGSVGKIDAALNDGPDNLIAAITNDLGIPINHYIEINFDGFRRSIDAMGGIKMSFPTPLRDTYSGLNISQVGCQALNGATALAVVRARHLQYLSGGRWLDDPLSDLARIRRDHTFLRIFVTTAKGQLTNPLRLNALIGGLINQVTVDSGLGVNSLLDLFRRFRHLDANAVPETTLPITVVPNYHYGAGAFGDVDMPVEPLDHQVVAAWAAQSGPAPAPGAVRVVNISGTFHKAATVATALTALGYQVTATATGPVPAATTETVVRYPPGSVAAAIGLLGNLSGAVVLAPDPTITDGSLTLDVGSVLAVSPPAPPPAATPATGAATGAVTAAPTGAVTAAPTTSIPTALHQSPSSAQDQAQPFDPTACP